MRLSETPAREWAYEILNALADAMDLSWKSDPDDILEQALEYIYRLKDLER